MKERDPIREAYEKALHMGGKQGLNCIAELAPVPPSDGDSGLPLGGVPVLVKDNIDVKGFCTAAGSLALADNTAEEDAPVIRNLRRNGAAILGKTNMTEFANYVDPSMPAGYSSRGGQVKHAVNPALSPGGSSTGSAVAVSAGIVPMAVGTDTSHSITLCAKINGICGLKPPAGALSQKGILPLAPTFDSAGALAASFGDALRLYSAMRDEPLGEIRPGEPGKLRLAVNRAGIDRISEAEGAFLERTVMRIREAGTTAEEVDQPWTPELKTVMKYEFGPMLEEYLRTSAASLKTLSEIVAFYEERPDVMMKYGASFLKDALTDTPGGLCSPEYRDALRIRGESIRKVTEEISPYDAVIVSGPTSIMHFCSLPCVTVASSEKDENGVRRALILYGADELRLYSAALAIEGMLREEGE